MPAAVPYPRAAAAKARGLMAEYDIRAPGPAAVVARLSGGNQQKIVVARELDRAPAVLVAHQATWGLDPGATRFVLDRVIALARRRRGGALHLLRTRGGAGDRRPHRGDGGRRLCRRGAARRGRPAADRPLDGRAGGMSEPPVPSLPLAARAAALPSGCSSRRRAWPGASCSRCSSRCSAPPR